MILAKVNTLTFNDPGFPEVLKNIPSPPKTLYYSGCEFEEWINEPKVAVVGSRKISPYGLATTHRLVTDLARVGVVIISGLAFGVDGAAHRAALESRGRTVSVLPTSLKRIYPVSHINLARQIIENGGMLISEYASDSFAFKENFIARNRIVSGLADILLITEAAVNSGSLHTARFALEQGKTVMAVPGNITSPTSEGCNNLIKSGAIPVTSSEDIFFALNLPAHGPRKLKTFKGSAREEKLFKLISEGIASQDELAEACRLDAADVTSALTALEISGAIRPLGGGNWTAS